MMFVEGARYFSDDNRELYVIRRYEHNRTTDGRKNPRIRAEVGFAMPGVYKIRTGYLGREYVIAKGHRFEAR